jgi:predicted RNA-binding protein with PIN domain
MPYLIDGHNLIPKIPGLSLQAVDDEMQLVQKLQEFCQRRGKQAEVYFDNAPPGQDGKRRFGPVTAYFVRRGQTADAAIHLRLRRLGRAAPNWTVVSSDGYVQSTARAAGAQALSAETFAGMLREGGRPAGETGKSGENPMSPDELQEWLRLFKGKKDR